MSMIPCGEDCVYQKDGYCSLDVPPLVVNSDFKGCVHKISFERHPAGISGALPFPPQPQTHPGDFSHR